MLKRILLSVIVFTFSGCGGSGGGGSDSSSSSGSKTGIRVLHGSIDSPPVDVSDNAEGSLIQSVRFAEKTGYANMMGEHTIVVSRRNLAGSPSLSKTVSVSKDERKDIILFGRLSSGTVSLREVSSLAQKVSGDVALVRLINGVSGASEVRLDISGASLSASPGEGSDYMEILPGATTFSATGGGRQLEKGSFEAVAGNSYTIFISGDMSLFVTGTVLDN